MHLNECLKGEFLDGSPCQRLSIAARGVRLNMNAREVYFEALRAVGGNGVGSYLSEIFRGLFDRER